MLSQFAQTEHDIDLSKQRPADYVFEKQVDNFMSEDGSPREAAE